MPLVLCFGIMTRIVVCMEVLAGVTDVAAVRIDGIMRKARIIPILNLSRRRWDLYLS